MANIYTQILLAGLQANYDNLETKDPNKLYFCTDTRKIYKGEVDFSNNILVAASKPENPIAGKIYIFADTNTVEVYVNGSWLIISYPVTDKVDINSDDFHIASAAAVYNAITEAISNVSSSGNTVSIVAPSETTEGGLTITKGNGKTEHVTVPGVVTTPLWDSATRKLTMPISDADAVVIEFGKDIFLDTTANNGYDEERQAIILYLNDGSENTESTEIIIPAGDLVDIYKGGKTDSATTTVTEGNVINVAINIDPDENNALVLSSAGLKVDLSAYAKTADVNAQISTVQTTAENAMNKANTNANAITILNGDENTEGSVKKSIADTKAILDAVDQKHDTAIANVQASVQTTNENLAALATATTEWGAF